MESQANRQEQKAGSQFKFCINEHQKLQMGVAASNKIIAYGIIYNYHENLTFNICKNDQILRLEVDC